MIDRNTPQTTESNSSNTPHPSPTWASDSLREIYNACVPAKEQEQESLAKVRRQLLQNFPSTATTHAKRPWFRIVWPSIASVGALAFLLFLWPRTEALQPLTLQGIAPTHTQNKGELRFQTDQSTALIVAKDQWSINLSQQSAFTLQRHHARKTGLHLLRGRVQIAVQPQTKTAFVVHSQRWQVRVKGTQFAVARSADALRVEVWSGQVEVHRQDRSFLLGAGEGARIHLPTARIHRFPVPPLSLLQPAHRLQWALELPPNLCAQYALDLIQQDALPVAVRSQTLQQIITSLVFRSPPSVWLPLLDAQTQLERDPLAQETALYLLLQRCYAHAPTRCLPLSTWYIKHFATRGMRPFLARVHFLRANALASQPRTAKQGLLELKSYRETFPQGLDQRRACDRIKITLNHSARSDLQPLQENIGEKSSWFSRYCPFSKDR